MNKMSYNRDFISDRRLFESAARLSKLNVGEEEEKRSILEYLFAIN